MHGIHHHKRHLHSLTLAAAENQSQNKRLGWPWGKSTNPKSASPAPEAPLTNNCPGCNVDRGERVPGSIETLLVPAVRLTTIVLVANVVKGKHGPSSIHRRSGLRLLRRPKDVGIGSNPVERCSCHHASSEVAKTRRIRRRNGSPVWARFAPALQLSVRLLAVRADARAPLQRHELR